MTRNKLAGAVLMAALSFRPWCANAQTTQPLTPDDVRNIVTDMEARCDPISKDNRKQEDPIKLSPLENLAFKGGAFSINGGRSSNIYAGNGLTTLASGVPLTTAETNSYTLSVGYKGKHLLTDLVEWGSNL